MANLFYNMATGKMGLVGIWDAIGFDEVADLQKMPKEVVTTLKIYCESGTFARGKDSVSGTASIAMFGNTNQPVEVMVRSSHLFMPMPEVIREDMAFIDRHFSLGSHLNARDVKAVRKTVSGLVKLIYPTGQLTKQELREIVELALEGRRRVKEQLKKINGPLAG